MKNALRALVCALLPLLCSSCFLSRSFVNTELDAGRLSQLVPGQTTAREVVDALGAPVDVVQLARRSAYLYQYQKSKTSGLFLLVLLLRGVDTKEDRIWVFFDENEILTHVGTTFESQDSKYGIPIFSSGN